MTAKLGYLSEKWFYLTPLLKDWCPLSNRFLKLAFNQMNDVFFSLHTLVLSFMKHNETMLAHRTEVSKIWTQGQVAITMGSKIPTLQEPAYCSKTNLPKAWSKVVGVATQAVCEVESVCLQFHSGTGSLCCLGLPRASVEVLFKLRTMFVLKNDRVAPPIARRVSAEVL